MNFDKTYLKTEYLDKNRTESSLADEFGISPKLMHYYLKRAGLVGIKSRRKYTVDESLFKLSDPVFCYYAGLIATDGYIDLKNHRVSLRLQNDGAEEVMRSIAEYFNFSGEIHLYRKCFDLTITSDVLIKRLGSLNIKGGKKTYNLDFPKIFSANEDCKRMFMRGILDGDGNIHLKLSSSGKVGGGQFRLVTASHDFIDGVIRFVNKCLNLECKKSIARVKGAEYPKLEMRISDSLKFYNWVYVGYEKFRLKDKYSKYQLLLGEEIV